MELSKKVEQAIASFYEVLPIYREAQEAYAREDERYVAALLRMKELQKIYLERGSLAAEELEEYRRVTATEPASARRYQHECKMRDAADEALRNVYRVFREEYLKTGLNEYGGIDR
jgi:hypothetical protein